MPCMSGGSSPSRADHSWSRCSPSRWAASAHCTFRCWVGATTTRPRQSRSARCRAAATSANVVLPAPGVATARKSLEPADTGHSDRTAPEDVAKSDLARTDGSWPEGRVIRSRGCMSAHLRWSRRPRTIPSVPPGRHCNEDQPMTTAHPPSGAAADVRAPTPVPGPARMSRMPSRPTRPPCEGRVASREPKAVSPSCPASLPRTSGAPPSCAAASCRSPSSAPCIPAAAIAAPPAPSEPDAQAATARAVVLDERGEQDLLLQLTSSVRSRGGPATSRSATSTSTRGSVAAPAAAAALEAAEERARGEAEEARRTEEERAERSAGPRRSGAATSTPPAPSSRPWRARTSSSPRGSWASASTSPATPGR
jgi:hypothetical protein